MPRHLLIVDDEPDVATYLATALRANGYSVAVANSVEEGMGEVTARKPDLICLDIMMPRESGLSMLGHLRESAATAAIPVIVISGAIGTEQFNLDQFVNEEGTKSPHRFLEKPVEVETFLQTISELLTEPAKGGQGGRG